MLYIDEEIQLAQTEVCTDTDSSKDNNHHVHGLINHHDLHGFDSNILHTLKSENEMQCVDCDKFFTNEESLMAHRHIYHDGASASKNSNDKAYECDVCMKVFNKHSSWWKHKKCHTGERAYKCYICEKTFTQQANLHRHMYVHSGEKPHGCTLCDKRFSQAANLVKHQITHTNEKPFTCSICMKGFTQRANLKKHEMVHTGERPHACPICKKAYTQYANMKKHMLVHTKSKQSVAYLCAKCKILFDTISRYDEHLEGCQAANEDNLNNKYDLNPSNANESAGANAEYKILGTTSIIEHCM